MRGPGAMVAWALCGMLAGCGDDAPGQDTDGGTDTDDGGDDLYTLSDGTRVYVSPTGTVRVVRNGRAVFEMSDDARPRLHRYTETVGGGLGIWTFARDAETTVVFDQLGEHGLAEDTVRVAYQAVDGSALELAVTVHRAGEAARITLTPRAPTDAQGLSLPLACDDAATFFGFGEQYHATDQRGEVFDLLVTEQGIGRDPASGPLPTNGGPHTTYFPMPYYFDARGFGGLWQTDRRVRVDLCATNPEAAWFETTQATQDVIVYYGPTGYDVIRQLGDDVGRPPMPPSWAWELWVAAQGGQDAAQAEVDALLAADIPVGALWVQDWTGIRMNFDGGFGVQYRWEVDDTLYPDLAGFIAGLHDQGIRFLGYANPFVDTSLQHHTPMADQGLLIENAGGTSYDLLAPNGMSSLPDFTDPAAETFVQGFLGAMVTDLGMDGMMADFGEWAPLDAVYSDGTDPAAAHNLYPVWWHRTWRGAMNAARPDGDWAVIVRSGWTGAQAHAQIYWVGDQEADFLPTDGLPTVVPAMINLGLIGVPFVTHDIAGFSGGPSTKELYLRWIELGAFTPIMRTHEGANKLDNWSWERDAETTASMRRFALVHQALQPQLVAWAGEAVTSSKPLVRHLMLEFPDDPVSRTVSDEYLLGDAFLVAPVTTAGATTRSVYLPPGTWFHVFTGQQYQGETTIEVDAPIGTPPVFSRDVDRPDLRAME